MGVDDEDMGNSGGEIVSPECGVVRWNPFRTAVVNDGLDNSYYRPWSRCTRATLIRQRSLRGVVHDGEVA